MAQSALTCLLRIRRGFCWALVVGLILNGPGCSRSFYRTRADEDAFSILWEKTAETPWEPSAGYDIQPDPRSRLFDPTPIDDPLLPPPLPRLYDYELSEYGRRHQEGLSVSDSLSPRAVLAVANQPTALGDFPDDEADIGISPVVIPEAAWQSIPRSCRLRMFEFESIREEYDRSYGAEPSAADRDPAPRLTLEDIVELALLNSREYQTEKENLYRVALRLTLQRFDYELKFSPTGNRSTIDYGHTRIGGETVNTLAVPSRLQADKLLATGGELIARFANDVVLTFNGPEGFAADVGSELLFSFTQTVFQRDVIFEPLTQAERNVVYAARSFARFRKTFFFGLASQYYNLLQTYRQVEIDSQNYFTLVRAFEQRAAEYQVGLVPRVQVDQVEQNALEGRSSLIGTCNRLEAALDNLKISMGLPTETAINLDLTELEQLTLTDQVAVASELVERVRTRLQSAREQRAPGRVEVLNLAIELIVRMLNSYDLRRRLGDEAPDVAPLQVLQARLQVDELRLRVRSARARLTADRMDPGAPPIRILQRTMELIDALLALLSRQERLAAHLQADAATIERIRRARTDLGDRLQRIEEELDAALAEVQVDRIADLVEMAGELLGDAEEAVRSADATLETDAEALTEEAALERTLAEVDLLLDESRQLLDEVGAGLVPVDIGVDEAMLTALVERFDLMNERGFLADDWRQIKLAADELKSVLNLGAAQTIATKSGVNRFLDFTFDDSQTRLSATFDAPLNRRAQRNRFRERLLDYQQGRRGLMQREDAIKLAVRNDLRDLDLAQEQYLLGVASAGLAFERVVSTELQLRFGVANVESRDFLEAQTAFARALSNVAVRHISHILTRARLFLDLELLRLDDAGFWPPLYDDAYQPTPTVELPPHFLPPYGELPSRVKHSNELRRMYDVPLFAE